jgi:hypothetical protein
MNLPTPGGAAAETGSEAFVARSQSGFSGRQSKTGFTLLPAWVSSEIGLSSRRGARLDAAILARLIACHQRFAGGQQAVPVTGLGSVPVGEGEFIASILSICKSLYVRWFGAEPEGEHFDRFYERAKQSTRRLSKRGWVTHLRATNPNGTGSHGSIWTFTSSRLAQTNLGQLPLTPDRGDEQPADEDLVNVVDLIGSAFVSENPARFTQTDVIANIEKPRTLQADFMEWASSIAMHGARGERFMSVGAWEGLRNDRDPVFVPWLVLDMERRRNDEHDVEEAYYATQRTLEELADELGVDLAQVIVSSTGGKGYHIRIPSGMLGNPIFQNATESVKVLRSFAAHFISEPVDQAVLNPHQAIRLIGSRRDSGLFTRAWTGLEFFDSVGFYQSLEACRVFEPFQLTDPRTVALCPDLAFAMICASDLTRHVLLPEFGGAKEFDGFGTGAVVSRSMEGCEEGEVWYDDGVKVHMGRSKLIFIAACHLIRELDGDTASALEGLRIVNARCTPPLRESELKGRLMSAMKSHDRKGAYQHRRK